MSKVRIIPKAPSPGHKGKRARRAAFYHLQRRERLLQRVVANIINSSAHLCVIENAFRDALVTGIGWARMP